MPKICLKTSIHSLKLNIPSLSFCSKNYFSNFSHCITHNSVCHTCVTLTTKGVSKRLQFVKRAQLLEQDLQLCQADSAIGECKLEQFL